MIDRVLPAVRQVLRCSGLYNLVGVLVALEVALSIDGESFLVFLWLVVQMFWCFREYFTLGGCISPEMSFETVIVTCCICCAPSSNLPSLKTGLPHLLTKPWSEDGAPVLRPGRSEDGAGGRKMGQGQKMGQVLKSSFSKYFIKNCIVYHFLF